MSITEVDRSMDLIPVKTNSSLSTIKEYLAEQLFCLSAALNTPLCLGGRYLVRCLSKIPGKDVVRPDFFANRTIERMVRIPLFIIALVIGFIGIIFAIPGTLAHALACTLQGRRFNVIGNDAVRVSTAESISILWWNVAGIAGGIGRIQGGLPDCEDRVDAIAQVIIDQNCDLVALTEVYDKSFQNRLERHLRKRGYLIIKNVGLSVDFTKAPSGLFLASKVPVKNILFTTFDIKHLEACKGFLSCTVSLQRKDVHVIATHLQHSSCEEDPSREEIDRRTAQLALIRTHVQRVGLPAILAGDLNICAAEEFPLLVSFWKPACGEPTVTYTNRGVREVWSNPPLREYPLDFIRSNQLNVRVERIEALYTAGRLQLSDHWPLRAEIKG